MSDLARIGELVGLLQLPFEDGDSYLDAVVGGLTREAYEALTADYRALDAGRETYGPCENPGCSCRVWAYEVPLPSGRLVFSAADRDA